MFRLALLSSLFAVATAHKLGAVSQFERAMQLDLDAFQFNFAGININAELAQAECPNQWGPTVSCVIGKCPQFMEVCPDLNIPEENLGTVPPSAEVPAVESRQGDMMMGNMTDDEMMMDSNMTDAPMMDSNMTDAPMMDTDAPMPEMPMTNSTDMPMTNDEIPVIDEEVPGCEEIEESFCEVFGGEGLEECCLTDCTAEIQDLLTCVVLQTTGEDRSDCEIPTCPGSTLPGTTSGDRDAAPAETTSSAASVATRVAATATALAAVAML